MRRRDCVFCAILDDKTPAHWVFREGTCAGFLDARPLFPGHTLVVPAAHRETIADVTPDELEAVFAAARKLCAAVERALGAEGAFVALNNRISQSVPHVHVHVVPRRKGDGLRGFFWPRQKYADEGEAARIAAQLGAALDA